MTSNVICGMYILCKNSDGSAETKRMPHYGLSESALWMMLLSFALSLVAVDGYGTMTESKRHLYERAFVLRPVVFPGKHGG